jgi:hypothetical protein
MARLNWPKKPTPEAETPTIVEQPEPETPPLTLAERIRAIRDEVEALIQSRIAAEAAQCGGLVHAGTLRMMFDNKYGRCACRVHDQLCDEEFKARDPEGYEAEMERRRQERLRS